MTPSGISSVHVSLEEAQQALPAPLRAAPDDAKHQYFLRKVRQFNMLFLLALLTGGGLFLLKLYSLAFAATWNIAGLVIDGVIILAVFTSAWPLSQLRQRSEARAALFPPHATTTADHA